MVGPTGGYLLGYLVASWVVGRLALGKGTFGRVGAMLAGLLPVYAIGAAWLTTYVPVDQVLAVGVMPFLLGDLVKIGVVATGSALLTTSLTGFRGKRK
jgi:biotin transport system substrate-specific component